MPGENKAIRKLLCQGISKVLFCRGEQGEAVHRGLPGQTSYLHTNYESNETFVPPQLTNIEARLASFKDWPEELEMKPEELAEAGFFHSPQDNFADLVSAMET